jgi:hypothetical protein
VFFANINTKYLELAHRNLLDIIPSIERRIKDYFEIDDYNIVIYVGLENGAGWVTDFMRKPSILFGLKAIVNLEWIDKLEGLIAHEFGHLVHWSLRRENMEELENDEKFWLYTERFAQRIEDLIVGRPWHFEEDEWFDWCEENEALLKQEFLRRIGEKEPLNPFFGSWYELFEKQFLGYYLEYKFIRWLEDELSLERIAKLKREKIESKILEFLRL